MEGGNDVMKETNGASEKGGRISQAVSNVC